MLVKGHTTLSMTICFSGIHIVRESSESVIAWKNCILIPATVIFSPCSTVCVAGIQADCLVKLRVAPGCASVSGGRKVIAQLQLSP